MAAEKADGGGRRVLEFYSGIGGMVQSNNPNLNRLFMLLCIWMLNEWMNSFVKIVRGTLWWKAGWTRKWWKHLKLMTKLMMFTTIIFAIVLIRFTLLFHFYFYFWILALPSLSNYMDLLMLIMICLYLREIFNAWLLLILTSMLLMHGFFLLLANLTHDKVILLFSSLPMDSFLCKKLLNNLVLGLQKDTGDARAFSFLQILQLIPLLLQPPSMLFVENVVGFEVCLLPFNTLVKTLN